MYQTVPGSSGMAFVSPDMPVWHDIPGITIDLTVEGMVVPEPHPISYSLIAGFLLLLRFRKPAHNPYKSHLGRAPLR